MKKIYEAPSIEIVRITQQLLNGGSPLDKYTTPVTDEDDVLSREASSFWDDDED